MGSLTEEGYKSQTHLGDGKERIFFFSPNLGYKKSRDHFDMVRWNGLKRQFQNKSIVITLNTVKSKFALLIIPREDMQ